MAQINHSTRKRVLVTGASGFVGSALCPELTEQGFRVRCVHRTPPARGVGLPSLETAVVGKIGPDTDWRRALSDVSVVIHLLARTHVMRETSADPLSAYRRINVIGTRALAYAAARAGTHRFIFMSSVKVNGERTTGRPFTENALPQPEDAYGISKWEAEQALDAVARETGMEIVVLRAPLIYGPGVKGNILRLMRWIARRVPLPLASINNHRSLLYVGNLVDALVACIDTPAAAGKTYLLSDGRDVSTPALISELAAAMNMPHRLFRCPHTILRMAATILGKNEEVRRLTESLQVDSSKIHADIGWAPRFELAQGLVHTAQWYHSQFTEKPVTQ